MPKPQPSDKTMTVLESRVQLSSSVIWQAQQRFYTQRGIKAWTEDRVPELITNNPFIADSYASIVFEFLRDCASSGSETAPLRIIELGAGTGRFAYLFLRRLMQLMKEHGEDLNGFRYCMTDCIEGLLHTWRKNQYLQEFVVSGNLQFGYLCADAEMSAELGAIVPDPTGPLVVIANYVFDSLPQDAFVVREGKLFEVLVTTTTTAPPVENASLSDLQRTYETVEAFANRYPEATINSILAQYCSRLTDAHIAFPSAALNAVRALTDRSDGRALFLVGDKGFTHEDCFPAGSGEPLMEFHTPQCFSQMVNFDAIGKYFEATSGIALLPEKRRSNFNICAFLRGRPGDSYPATRKSYLDMQGAFGVDDLFSLLAWLNPHIEEMSLAQALAVLRLTHWDPMAFLRLAPVLMREARSAGVAREDMRAALSKVWSNYFPVSPADTALAFNCGVILLELRYFVDALGFFDTSRLELGPTAATSYNMGLCHKGLGDRPKALTLVTEACKLDPSFEPALLAREGLLQPH